ncbi:MAG: Oligopeptide transport system permease protein OppB [Streptosporangiaceae bacterium]|nr:Oligopeptide transport system permease protein OppB [Streptosporangiaceae bacterium]
MIGFLIRRIAIAIPVLIGILLLAFILVRLLPGSPLDQLIPPDARTGPDSAAYIESVTKQFGLDQPLPIQWLLWMRGVVTGNLGFSYTQNQSVVALIGSRIGSSALLIATGLILALVIAIPLGVFAALRKKTWFDYSAVGVSMVAISVPVFFLGLIAIYIFSLRLGWFPSGGRYSIGTDETFGSLLWHLTLPACVLAAVLVGPYTRYIRQSMLGVLQMDYIKTATAKGVPRSQVVIRHGLRNALVPLITVVSVQAPALLAGTVVIETVFAWPGVGKLVYDGIANRDYPVILGVVLLSAVFVLVFNILADLASAILDPRIRL